MAQAIESTVQTFPAATPKEPARARQRVRIDRKTIITFFLMGLIVLLALAGLHFYAMAHSYQSTDDAFVDAHIINVAPKIAGRVDQVLVSDNQEVQKGQPLIVIDARDQQAALRQKQSALASVKAEAAAAQAGVEQASAHVKTLQATVASDQATAEADRATSEKTRKDAARYEQLAAQKVVSSQDLDTAKAAAASSEATYQAAVKKVVSDEAQVREGLATVNTYLALYQSIQAQINESDANVEAAELTQSYTTVNAPEAGRVTRKSVEAGNYIQAGQAICALVSKDIWITANFKENQIGAMRPGQEVGISIDALHGQQFRGQVDSIQAGSGARFSLLPPENATGNYVKVVQRVPVKILFSETPDTPLPIGPGESAVPTVKVSDFHYSAVSLAWIGGIVLCLLCLIYRWRNRQPKEKQESA